MGETKKNKTKKAEMNNVLIYLDEIYKKDWDKIYSHLERKEKVDLKEVDRLVEKKRKNKKIITVLDTNYPPRYKTFAKPPFVVETKKRKG